MKANSITQMTSSTRHYLAEEAPEETLAWLDRFL
jgi:hypothetical protein